MAATAAVVLLSLGASSALAAPGVKVGSAAVNVSGTIFPYLGTATASCPGSSKVVSGGFSAPADPSSATADVQIFNGSRSAKKSWSVTGYNNGGTDGALSAFAYCLKGVKIKSATGSGLIPGTAPYTGSATAQCPKRTKVISGGFQAPGWDPTFAGPAIFPYSSQRTGNRSWTVLGENSGNTTGSLTAIAYCIKDVPGPKARATSSPVADGTGTSVFGTATASCKSHEFLISGGFNTPGFDSSNTFGPDLYYTRSFKGGGQSWIVGGDNYGKAGSITSIAYCYRA